MDVLRFFAFFLVFLGHAGYQLTPRWAANLLVANVCLFVNRASFSGVCLFFTLSSYLITELLLQEREKTGTIHFTGFYLRRILRIWPLYFVFLLLVRPFAAHYIPWEHLPRNYLAAFLLLVGNWACVRHGWPASIAAPLWSISIEEQFYLVWPLTVAWLRRHLLAVTLTMLIVANVSRVVLLPVPDPSMWCNTLARIDPFALGALLAYAVHGRKLEVAGVSRILMGLLSFTLLLINGRYGEHEGERALFYYPVEALGCVLLLAAVLLPMGSWRPGIPGRILVYLGRISYGLYVFHLMYLDLMARWHFSFLVSRVVALVLTIATASVSYYVLEKPFLQLKRRFTYVSSRL